MRRNGHKTTSGQMFNPKFETPMGCFLFDANFGGAYYKIYRYAYFVRKTAFVGLMQNFRNLGASGGGADPFWRNPQKAHPWLISRVLSHYACKSVQGFFL